MLSDRFVKRVANSFKTSAQRSFPHAHHRRDLIERQRLFVVQEHKQLIANRLPGDAMDEQSRQRGRSLVVIDIGVATER